MKKTVLSVLIVLLLSVVLFGCGGKECEVCGEVDCVCNAMGPSTLSGEAKAALVAIVGQDYADNFPVPQGASFYNFESGGKFIAFYWEAANQFMFDNYKTEWLSRSAVEVIGDHTDGKFQAATKIVFDGVGGDAAGGSFKYPANTIIFSGTAN